MWTETWEASDALTASTEASEGTESCDSTGRRSHKISCNEYYSYHFSFITDTWLLDVCNVRCYVRTFTCGFRLPQNVTRVVLCDVYLTVGITEV